MQTRTIVQCRPAVSRPTMEVRALPRLGRRVQEKDYPVVAEDFVHKVSVEAMQRHVGTVPIVQFETPDLRWTRTLTAHGHGASVNVVDVVYKESLDGSRLSDAGG